MITKASQSGQKKPQKRTPPALPHFTVFHHGLDGPEALFIVENPAPVAESVPAVTVAPEVPTAPPLEFSFPAVELVQPPPSEQSPLSQSTPHPVFEEQLLPLPQSPVPASPCPLSPLPAEEEACLENQENIPSEVASPIFACPPCVDDPVPHPHKSVIFFRS